ncbi:MAG: pyruvate formate lyase-activating protein [Clostridia bacterium]|nr:pyruvate formate lyase-activating protein [Clostridia bacterium]
MLGRIHSFESFGTVDGPGIRFVVFMQGCPMRCAYCHNPDTWNLTGGRLMESGRVAGEAMKYYRYIKNGGVTVTGGEPLLQRAFVAELFEKLHEEGLHTALDTSGITFDYKDKYVIEEHNRVLENTDLVLLDIKHIDNDRHVNLTGKPNDNILAFARYLDMIGKDVWIRHVLVPGLTDKDEYLTRLNDFISTLSNVKKVEVLPYHTMGEAKYEKLGMDYRLKGLQPPSDARVQNARRILGADGAYGSNAGTGAGAGEQGGNV